MKVGILCTKFSLDTANKWLTNELAESLRKNGCAVDVFYIDWASQNQKPCEKIIINGVKVYRVTAISKGAAVKKWIFSSWRLLDAIKNEYKDSGPDLIISFSPSVTMLFPLIFINFLKSWNSFLIQWDFFPYHHRQIGLINNNIYYFLAKFIESMLIRGFKNIGCMSEKNISYLKMKFPLKKNQNISIVPIWGGDLKVDFLDRNFVREKYKLPLDEKIVVFGGQLVAGRGIEDIIETAKLFDSSEKISFLIVGVGNLEVKIFNYIKQGGKNIRIISQIPRDEYIQLLGACDAGLVCTVRSVDVPSFPSKTIDYLRAGLPIIASVEKSTDYGIFLKENGVGDFTEAGNSYELRRLCRFVLNDDEMIEYAKRNGAELINNYFNIDKIVEKIIKNLH